MSMNRKCLVLLAAALFGVTTASAQTADARSADFAGLGNTRTSLDVVSATGTKTRGRLVRFDADSLILERDGREVRFDRREVARIYRRGDSLKNGILIGVGVGAALGTVMGLTVDCGGYIEDTRSCRAGEKATLVGVLGGTLAALGIGIGVGMDALFTGRQLLYEAPSRPGTVSMIVAPLASRTGAGVQLRLTW